MGATNLKVHRNKLQFKVNRASKSSPKAKVKNVKIKTLRCSHRTLKK